MHPLEKLSFDFVDMNHIKEFYNKRIHHSTASSRHLFDDHRDLGQLLLMEGIAPHLQRIHYEKDDKIQSSPIEPKKSLPLIERCRQGKIDLNELILNLSDNYGLKILSAHLKSPGLKKLAHEFFVLFERGININIYIISGMNKKGYSLHLDSGAYFIKQISGKKEWFFPIDENGNYLKDTHGLLQKYETRSHFEQNIKGLKSFIVDKNDCLHFPVGYPHFAISRSEGLSIHLTVAIHEYREIDYSNFLSFYTSKSPYECIDKERCLNLFDEKNKEDMKEKWDRYLLDRNFSLLKRGYLGSPLHFIR